MFVTKGSSKQLVKFSTTDIQDYVSRLKRWMN
jgi:hypothetical protein